MRGDRLDYATEQIWSTPRASDAEKGGPNQQFGAGGTPLPAQTAQWMTPRAHEVGQYQYDRGDKTKPVPTLTGQAEVETFSRPDPAMPRDGPSLPTATLRAYRRCRATTDSCLRFEMRALLRMGIRARGKGWARTQPAPFIRPAFRRQLNPIFVEWLMGWPPGWTMTARGAAPNGSACSETALSRYRQLMRSALSSLASPPAASPAQTDVFELMSDSP